MALFRGVIAFFMAIVGSTILDQTMFGKDIDKQMANTIELQVAELTPKRVGTIDEKLTIFLTSSNILFNGVPTPNLKFKATPSFDNSEN